jgi:hypothetical protein
MERLESLPCHPFPPHRFSQSRIESGELDGISLQWLGASPVRKAKSELLNSRDDPEAQWIAFLSIRGLLNEIHYGEGDRERSSFITAIAAHFLSLLEFPYSCYKLNCLIDGIPEPEMDFRTDK